MQFPSFGVSERKPPGQLIARLAHEIAKDPIPMEEPVHHFTQGIYARELTIKAGTVVVGKRHKCPHLFVVTKGWMYVYGTEGKKRVEAGDVFSSIPGAQRVAWAPEVDCTCLAIHATETTDLAALEAELVETPELEYDPMEMLICHGE